MPWTPEQTEMAIKLFELGISASQAAKRINGAFDDNKSRNSVIGKWHRMGLVRHMGFKPTDRKPLKASSIVKPTSKDFQGPSIAKRVNILREIAAEMRRVSEPAPVAEGPAPRLLPLVDLENGDCRFPISEVDGIHLFCALPKQAGSSYCCGHAKLMYVRPRQNLPTRAHQSPSSRKAA